MVPVDPWVENPGKNTHHLQKMYTRLKWAPRVGLSFSLTPFYSRHLVLVPSLSALHQVFFKGGGGDGRWKDNKSQGRESQGK